MIAGDKIAIVLGLACLLWAWWGDVVQLVVRR